MSSSSLSSRSRRLLWTILIISIILNVLFEDQLVAMAGHRLVRKLIGKKSTPYLLMLMKLKKRKKYMPIPIPLPIPVPLLPIALAKLAKELDKESEYYFVKDGDIPPRKVVRKYVDHHDGNSEVLWDNHR
ncbi:hypothetical protein DERF_002455 [Dermatophagoides farinae]|uniref:Uncharacterized protein n=1 Tax=Dermatophagoides farinae TaxID=6954 RepID=A0A922IBP2_DERFA|nr:hypothetical protein DERF_002455 [Dermatophagoides farinae]